MEQTLWVKILPYFLRIMLEIQNILQKILQIANVVSDYW